MCVGFGSDHELMAVEVKVEKSGLRVLVTATDRSRDAFSIGWHLTRGAAEALAEDLSNTVIAIKGGAS